MPTQKAKKIPEQDWLTHKQILKHLWLEEKREMLGDEGVVETMKARYGFSASRNQYDARFKTWKWSRNQKKANWELVSAVIHERERQGKESEVYVQGELQAPEKIRKEIRRYALSTPRQLAFSSAPQLPKSIAIRSPVVDRTASMSIGLPFYLFENSLRPSLPQSIDPRLTISGGSNAEASDHSGFIEGFERREQHPSIDATSTVNTASDTWTPGSSVLTTLKSVLPKSIAEENITGSSVILPETQIFTSPLHRQILFSVANNFAGLGALPIGDVIHFLQKETNQKLYQLIRLAPGYTSRAIGQNLFKAAIEAGDARVVELLLSENFADIDINQQFCFVGGRRFTPIERASTLRHKDVIKTLLKHHADVNRTHSDVHEIPSGALDCAVFGCTGGNRGTDVDPQIFRTLLKEGGDLSSFPMFSLIKSGDGELVRLFFSANACRNIAKWSEWGALRMAMEFLDDQTSMDIIKIMLKHGADLNYDVENSTRAYPRNVMDMAAQRGHFESVKLLIGHGALMTGDTLPCAIASGNEDLTQFLLGKGADINSLGSLRITLLAAEIRLQNPRIIKMIEGHGALAGLNDQAHFFAALKAASKVGNLPYIEHLIQVRGKVSTKDLDYALMLAIWNGRNEAAKMLIDAGADVNIHPLALESPLSEVLKRRNTDLVHSLLNADADVNYVPSGPQVPAIVLAAEWGDHPVVKDLIFAGASVNAKGYIGSRTALTVAVKAQDRVLVQLLLDAGADVNNPRIRDHRGTALGAAAQNGDVSMARYLLDQGADPDDSWALENAILQDAKLLELIFERYNKRYLKGRRGFGSTVLSQAIKKGNESVISMMLDRGLDANAMIYRGGLRVTPFGDAIRTEQVSIAESMELFLRKGCNPNSIVSQTDQIGFLPIRVTALLAAVSTRNFSKVELLIRYGADVNFPTRGPIKRTPLQRAAEVGSIEIVELLLHHGAEVNAPAAERRGATALQLAAIGGYIPIACALLNLKADVDAPGSKMDGRTALEGAAEHGRLDMVKVLLNEGAGSRGEDHAQFARAIALAKDKGHIAICDLLELEARSEDHGRGPGMLLDFNDEEFIDWDLDEGGSSF